MCSRWEDNHAQRDSLARVCWNDLRAPEWNSSGQRSRVDDAEGSWSQGHDGHGVRCCCESLDNESERSVDNTQDDVFKGRDDKVSEIDDAEGELCVGKDKGRSDDNDPIGTHDHVEHDHIEHDVELDRKYHYFHNRYSHLDAG